MGSSSYDVHCGTFPHVTAYFCSFTLLRATQTDLPIAAPFGRISSESDVAGK